MNNRKKFSSSTRSTSPKKQRPAFQPIEAPADAVNQIKNFLLRSINRSEQCRQALLLKTLQKFSRPWQNFCQTHRDNEDCLDVYFSVSGEEHSISIDHPKEALESLANLLLDRLESLKIVDDQRFSEQFINARAGRWHPNKTLQTLSQLGIESETIECAQQAIQELSSTSDDLSSLAFKILSRKPENSYEKQIKALLSKGFSYSESKKYFKQFKDEHQNDNNAE